jgi:CRP-like cAMP-binding protein
MRGGIVWRFELQAKELVVALKSNVKSLACLPFFSGFEPEALRLIAFAAQPTRYESEEVLFRYDEQSEGGYLIVSGSVRAEGAIGGAGKETFFGPGCLLGARALIIPSRNCVSAIARESTVTIRIPRDVIIRVLEEFPASALMLKTVVEEELRLLGFHLKEVVAGNSVHGAKLDHQ